MTQPTPLLAALILIVLGFLALLLGKRLFWLFAGIVGFALGWWLAGLLLPLNTDPLLRVIIGVVAGVILGAVTRFLGKWAIRLVAAIAGFLILPRLLGSLGMMSGIPQSLWAVIGAAVGFVFALFLVDWTLIFVSSILGAGLVLEGVQMFLTAANLGAMFTDAIRLIAGFLLIAVGVVIQARQNQ